MELYLQKIVDTIEFNLLPEEWTQSELTAFSKTKTLFEYQQQALKNSLKALYLYYITHNADKQKFFQLYQGHGLTKTTGLDLEIKKHASLIEQYHQDFNIQGNKIPFSSLINRMSFWMATGSGKTLIIVKLIELLHQLMKTSQIPKNEILFLTQREDLIDQFKKHIDEYNKAFNRIIINIKDLKEYETTKRDTKTLLENQTTVFYYRADLLSDQQKDKIMHFKNYENGGRWYIILDEAHKGSKEDSKRQLIYSILSRNGFLFNFSATFTEPVDFATCVYNFNLEKFIQQGYGKNIYITKSDLKNFSEKEFSDEKKQTIILKTFLLHSLIKKAKKNTGNYYHKPLMLTLVNSVNTQDSDLFLFFQQIRDIAQKGIEEKLLIKAKEELKKDLDGKYEFENTKPNIDEKDIENLTYQDILMEVFNTSSSGEIEIIKIPSNKQEIALKLKTSDTPFGLIKIGDISGWLKEKLEGFNIIENFEDESIFKKLNSEESDINILMGSRAFYEGWDSNRPNIILYINIGQNKEAKKFVLQSLGRGVRIEVMPHKRGRLVYLYNNRIVDKEIYLLLKNQATLLETLFVYGTKVDNLRQIVETVKEIKQEENIGYLFEINPAVKEKLLLIPEYRLSSQTLVEKYGIKYEINHRDLVVVEDFFNTVPDRVLIALYDCQPKILMAVKNSFKKKDEHYKVNTLTQPPSDPQIIARRLINFFSADAREFDSFKQLQHEIIHFKHITISKEKLKQVEEIIQKVKNYPLKDKRKQQAKERFLKGEIDIDGYTQEIENINSNCIPEDKEGSLKIKYIQNHYYVPVVLSDDEKVDYIKHIIKTKSELDFINDLDNYLSKDDNLFKNFDWWYFSKIDHSLDEIYIPYYQPKTNRIEKFKPDFIFWLKKDNQYTILFIDPKGTEHTDAYRKIDGYRQIFQKEPYSHDSLNIKVKLLLRTDNLSKVANEYKDFWFDNIHTLKDKI